MLVVAKAPVAGRVKTRLGAAIGMAAAAEVAASALLDSLLACTAAWFAIDSALVAADCALVADCSVCCRRFSSASMRFS